MKSELEITEFLKESNAIEGVYDDQSLKQAELAWEYLMSEALLSPGVILKTHKILMKNQPLKPREIGSFRQVPVYIGGKQAFDWTLIIPVINNWCERANLMVKYPGSGGRIEGDIKDHHVSYEKIHPFVDGNGRTGRMFLNWQRVRAGLPILVIKESEKEDYYDWF